jgi:hypothetical protein
MALIDKLDPDSTNRIAVHDFAAAMQGFVRGSFTRNQVIALFGFDSDDLTQLDQIKTVYDAKANAVSKLEYIIWTERVLLLFEARKITRQQTATLLELT